MPGGTGLGFWKSASIAELGGASPGFIMGRQGNAPTNTWLESEGISTNLVGVIVTVNGNLEKAALVTQDDETFTVTIYKRSGANFVSLDTISAAASRKTIKTFTGIQVVEGDELAAQVTSGSAQNIKLIGIITGNL